MPRKLDVNSSLLGDTIEPKLSITSEVIPMILLETSLFPQPNRTEDVPKPTKTTPETSRRQPALSDGVIGGSIGGVVVICLVLVVVLVKQDNNANSAQSRQDSHRKHEMVKV